MDIIRSKDNKIVKHLALLHDRKKASREGCVFAEGVRICEDALISGQKPDLIAVTPEREELAKSWIDKYGLHSQIAVMTGECFAKASSTVNPQGIAMVLREPDMIDDLPVRGNDIYMVLEDIQDPGNLGTMIRLADAFDMSAVIMTKGTADPFNEKVLRSSMGSVWRTPLMAVRDADEAIEILGANGICTIAAELGGEELHKADLRLPAAFFIGNEGNGLKTCTIDKCDKKIKIPMPGRAESLNAASAASIMGYSLMLLGLR